MEETRTEKQEKVQAGNQNPILPCTVTVSNSTHGRTRNLNSRSRNRVWLTVQGLLNRYYLTGKSRWSESTRRRWTTMSVLPISTISSRPSATTTTDGKGNQEQLRGETGIRPAPQSGKGDHRSGGAGQADHHADP